MSKRGRKADPITAEFIELPALDGQKCARAQCIHCGHECAWSVAGMRRHAENASKCPKVGWLDSVHVGAVMKFCNVPMTLVLST